MVVLLPFIGFALAGSIALATVYVYQRATATQRIARVRVMPAHDSGIAAWSALRSEGRSRWPLVDALPLSAVARERMETELDRAGVPLRVSEYLALRIAAAVVGILAGAFVAQRLGIASLLPVVAVALLFMAAGWKLPALWVARRRAQRLDAVERQLPEALTTLAKSLRSGTGLMQALAFTAEETGAPLGPELSQVLRELQLGASPELVFTELSQRMGSSDLDIAVTAIVIQRTVGGNLSEILSNVAGTIRERAKLYSEIKILTSRQRMTGNAMALLPLIVAAFFLLANAELGRLLVETVPGRISAAIGIAFEVAGLFLIRQLAKIDV